MEAYLEGKEPDAETLKKLIRKGTLNQSFVPVCCGSAFKNKGVQPLLDAVVDYLPSPVDIPPVKGLDEDDQVVYRSWGGQPSIDETDVKRNPLGPLQDIGPSTISVPAPVVTTLPVAGVAITAQGAEPIEAMWVKSASGS